MGSKFFATRVDRRFGREASETITVNRCVKINATDNSKMDMCGANERACGIAEFDYAAGNEGAIMAGGHLPIEAGSGGFSEGDELISDADGRGVPRGSVASTRYFVIGTALTDAAEGEVGMVDFRPYSTFGANAS